MNHVFIKKLFAWTFVIITFFLGFHFSTQRSALAEEIDYSVKQKLMEDFEQAFLKQYTPPLGCQDLELKIKPKQCIEHLKQSKNDFKQQFIKNRGLPKDTFEELKLGLSR